jgi:hypothetical protein
VTYGRSHRGWTAPDEVGPGSIDPGRVFDRAVGLEQVSDGFRAMANREALTVLIRP